MNIYVFRTVPFQLAVQRNLLRGRNLRRLNRWRRRPPLDWRLLLRLLRRRRPLNRRRPQPPPGAVIRVCRRQRRTNIAHKALPLCRHSNSNWSEVSVINFCFYSSKARIREMHFCLRVWVRFVVSNHWWLFVLKNDLIDSWLIGNSL